MTRKKPNKVRIEFRKKHESRTRDADLTRQFEQTTDGEFDTVGRERLTGKGNLTRHRTIVTGEDAESIRKDQPIPLDVQDDLVPGIVLRVHGLECIVQDPTGKNYRCAVRRLLKSVSTSERHVVVAGDKVMFRPEGQEQGMIHRIEPRYGVLSRTSKNRRHILVSNVDQLLIVASAAEPEIKPNLVDRFLATAEQNQIEAVICINKCDLIDPALLQPIIGAYAQIGYRVLMLSATKGWNIDLLRRLVRGRQSVVAGQSGVGKSSLLNAIEEGLHLRVQTVSQENQKGRHTTTTAEVFPLSDGGSIIDTPGIRQFRMWDIVPEEMSSLFRDVRPYANHCRFPNCTHVHETDCAVKDAVADGRLDVRRYESYCHMLDDQDDD